MHTYWIRYKMDDGRTYQCSIHADTKHEAERLFRQRNTRTASYEFIEQSHSVGKIMKNIEKAIASARRVYSSKNDDTNDYEHVVYKEYGVRDELIARGYVWVDYDDALNLTPDGDEVRKKLIKCEGNKNV